MRQPILLPALKVWLEVQAQQDLRAHLVPLLCLLLSHYPAPRDGNGHPRLKDIPSAVGEESLLEASSAQQEKQEGGRSVVPDVQPDVEPFEGAAGGLEAPEPQLESQRRQGEWVTSAAGSSV